MVAVVLEIDNGIVVHAAVAVGACSAVARRLPSLEKKLLAQPAVSGLSAVLDAADLSPLTPLDDVRGSGTFRRDAAQTLIARAIEGALGA